MFIVIYNIAQFLYFCVFLQTTTYYKNISKCLDI